MLPRSNQFLLKLLTFRMCLSLSFSTSHLGLSSSIVTCLPASPLPPTVQSPYGNSVTLSTHVRSWQHSPQHALEMASPSREGLSAPGALQGPAHHTGTSPPAALPPCCLFRPLRPPRFLQSKFCCFSALHLLFFLPDLLFSQRSRRLAPSLHPGPAPESHLQ